MTTHLKINHDIQWRINLLPQSLEDPAKTTALGIYIRKDEVAGFIGIDSYGPISSCFNSFAFILNDRPLLSMDLCKNPIYRPKVRHDSLINLGTGIIDIAILHTANDLTNRSKTRLSKCLAR